MELMENEESVDEMQKNMKRGRDIALTRKCCVDTRSAEADARAAERELTIKTVRVTATNRGLDSLFSSDNEDPNLDTRLVCSKSSAPSHQVAVSGSLSCDVCSKSFSSRTGLRRHKNVHSGILKFPCPHCTSVFGYGGNLKRHIRIHKGEKPFACQVCKREFSDDSHRKAHTKMHGRSDIMLPQFDHRLNQ